MRASPGCKPHLSCRGPHPNFQPSVGYIQQGISRAPHFSMFKEELTDFLLSLTLKDKFVCPPVFFVPDSHPIFNLITLAGHLDGIIDIFTFSHCPPPPPPLRCLTRTKSHPFLKCLSFSHLLLNFS